MPQLNNICTITIQRKVLTQAKGYPTQDRPGGPIKFHLGDNDIPAPCNITDFCRHPSTDLVNSINKSLHYEVINPIGEDLGVPSVVEQRLADRIYHEDVSDINGVAVQLWFEINRTAPKGEFISLSIKPNEPILIAKCLDPSELLKLANEYLAESGRSDNNEQQDGQGRREYRIEQIDTYDWFPREILDSCLARMDPYIVGDFQVEQLINLIPPVPYERPIVGRTDFTQKDRIIELKFVADLKVEHRLQTALYWAAQPDNAPRKDAYLMNVRTGEVLRLTSTPAEVDRIIALIICSKTHAKDIGSDQEFLDLTTRIRTNPCDTSIFEFELCASCRADLAEREAARNRRPAPLPKN